MRPRQSLVWEQPRWWRNSVIPYIGRPISNELDQPQAKAAVVMTAPNEMPTMFFLCLRWREPRDSSGFDSRAASETNNLVT